MQNATALVTGTLGLSFPKTAAAMRKAVNYARSGPCAVLVDINWRPVFWESLTPQAVQIVSEYAGGADILKLSEEEAEWLYGVHSEQAIHQPELVGLSQTLAMHRHSVTPHEASKLQLCSPVLQFVPATYNLQLSTGKVWSASAKLLSDYQHYWKADGISASRADTNLAACIQEPRRPAEGETSNVHACR